MAKAIESSYEGGTWEREASCECKETQYIVLKIVLLI